VTSVSGGLFFELRWFFRSYDRAAVAKISPLTARMGRQEIQWEMIEGSKDRLDAESACRLLRCCLYRRGHCRTLPSWRENSYLSYRYVRSADVSTPGSSKKSQLSNFFRSASYTHMYIKSSFRRRRSAGQAKSSIRSQKCNGVLNIMLTRTRRGYL